MVRLRSSAERQDLAQVPSSISSQRPSSQEPSSQARLNGRKFSNNPPPFITLEELTKRTTDVLAIINSIPIPEDLVSNSSNESSATMSSSSEPAFTMLHKKVDKPSVKVDKQALKTKLLDNVELKRHFENVGGKHPFTDNKPTSDLLSGASSVKHLSLQSDNMLNTPYGILSFPRRTANGLVLVPLNEKLPGEKIDEDLVGACKIVDGKAVVSGSPALQKVLEEEDLAGVQNNGTIQAVDGFIFNKLSDADLMLLRGLVKAYLIYLKNNEPEKKETIEKLTFLLDHLTTLINSRVHKHSIKHASQNLSQLCNSVADKKLKALQKLHIELNAFKQSLVEDRKKEKRVEKRAFKLNNIKEDLNYREIQQATIKQIENHKKLIDTNLLNTNRDDFLKQKTFKIA